MGLGHAVGGGSCNVPPERVSQVRLGNGDLLNCESYRHFYARFPRHHVHHSEREKA